jgi:hypothetical protein
VPTEDFWPSDLAAVELRTPLSILKEVAAMLGSKTSNAILAEVTTKSEAGLFYHRLYLVVPVLENYQYQLLTARHEILLYPVSVFWGKHFETCPDEGRFKEALKKILASSETRDILAALLAQAKATAS